MIEDMKLRGLAPGTQATYLEAVKVLARHYNRKLDEIAQEQVKDFLLYLIEPKGYAKSTYKVYSYHSCRNRSCPKCHKSDTQAWLQGRQKELLPVPYYHVIFTLPHELRRLNR